MLPAGPSQPAIVQTLRWLSQPVSFMESCRERYGANFSVRFLGFGGPLVMLSEPQAIRALYTERSNGLPPGRSLAQPVLGASSVMLLEGDEHLAQRKLMLPSFHGERMRSYEGLMRETAEREVQRWPSGEPFALYPHMQAVMMEVILRAVFGVSDSSRAQQLRKLLGELLDRSASGGWQLRLLLASRFKRGRLLAAPPRLLRVIDDVLLAEIAERRLDPRLAEREDMLSLLMSARMEDGVAMSDRELRDQLVTLLLAGHETTATALAWTLDLLLHNAPTLERLLEELEGGAGDEYLRAVIAESLRLRPVLPLAGRRLAVDLHAGDLHLPAGTDVTPAIWLTHTRPDIYPEPYAFRPERFLTDPPSTYAWIPFGGGLRRCLGASFAEFEMRVVLETVLRLRELAPVSPETERIARRNVMFSPRNGTRVRANTKTKTKSAAKIVTAS